MTLSYAAEKVQTVKGMNCLVDVLERYSATPMLCFPLVARKDYFPIISK